MLISDKIAQLLRERAIEHTTRNRLRVVSPLFLATNGRKPRLVIDMSATELNDSLSPLRARLNGVAVIRRLLHRDGHMFTTDLRSAFHTVRVHPRHRPLLGFEWQGRYYRFTVLPFGLRPSPALLAGMYRPLVDYLGRVSTATGSRVRFSIYVDDILTVVARDAPRPPPLPNGYEPPQSLTTDRAWAAWLGVLLAMLRLQTSDEKSAWVPDHVADYLGFTWATRPARTPRLFVPRERLRAVRRAARHLLRLDETGDDIHARVLATVVGKCNATTPAIQTARLHLHALSRTLGPVYAAAKSGDSSAWARTVRLNHEARTELNWWVRHAHAHNGARARMPRPRLELQTDASGTGWGAVLRRPGRPPLTAQGAWATTRYADMHVNQLELLTVLLALEAFGVTNTTVRVTTDSTVTMSYVNNLSGRRAGLVPIIRRLASYCQRHRVRLTATHIAGEENTIPDRLSRRATGGDYRVADWILRIAEERWGPLTFDRFASWTSRLPGLPFNSYHHQPGSSGHDALAQTTRSWRAHRNWCYPPWRLLHPLTEKLEQTGAEAIVLAPRWPVAAWFPRLLAITTDYVILPRHVQRPPIYNGDTDDWLTPPWDLLLCQVNGAQGPATGTLTSRT